MDAEARAKIESDVRNFGVAFTYAGQPIDPLKVVMHTAGGRAVRTWAVGQRVRSRAHKREEVRGTVRRVLPRQIGLHLDGSPNDLVNAFDEEFWEPIEGE